MITPAEALAAVTAEDAAEIAAEEKRIDRALLRYAGDPILIGAQGSERVRRRIANMYSAAGWLVTIHSDPRDGAYWTFRAADSGGVLDR